MLSRGEEGCGMAESSRHLSVSGVMTSLSVQPKNSFWYMKATSVMWIIILSESSLK